MAVVIEAEHSGRYAGKVYTVIEQAPASGKPGFWR
jgi:hypothetical protein